MVNRVSRRAVVLAAPAVGLGSIWAARVGGRAWAQESAAPAPAGGVGVAFPSGDPELARKAVGFSHGNLDGLRAIVDRQPELAKASIDWGFGDWETCIGAASHTGNRAIAAYLMSNGASPTIFTFAMLGDLAAVKAMVEAAPGVQRTLGPHGITLYRHAAAGGEGSAAVAEYLKSLGDADTGYVGQPLGEEDVALYAGDYAFGTGANDMLRFETKRFGFAVERPGSAARGLTYLGEHAFHPAGAPSVRLRFTVEEGRAVRVGVFNPDLIVEAKRVTK